MRTRDYRAAARAVLQGKWLKMVAIVLLVDKLGDNLRMIIDPYSAQE